jgi:peptide/nickel transport system permease protein
MASTTMNDRSPAAAQAQAAAALVRSRGPGLWRRLRRNRLAVIGAGWLLFIALASLAGPLIYRASPEETDIIRRLADPSPLHPLGTDETGRDVLARALYGGRVSLLVSLVAAGVALLAGTLVGVLAGHFGGWVEAALMRTTDTFMSVPLFFFLLTFLALFGASLGTLVLGIGMTSWMGVARVVRGEVLRHRSMEFVQAARALGAGDGRLMRVHLLPQAVPSIIVAANLGIAHAILAETSFSYLGIGIQPPTPSWGNMLSGAQNYVWTSPQLAFYPGLLILVTVLAFNAFGDGLRDALDPRFRGEQGV